MIRQSSVVVQVGEPRATPESSSDGRRPGHPSGTRVPKANFVGPCGVIVVSAEREVDAPPRPLRMRSAPLERDPGDVDVAEDRFRDPAAPASASNPRILPGGAHQERRARCRRRGSRRPARGRGQCDLLQGGGLMPDGPRVETRCTAPVAALSWSSVVVLVVASGRRGGSGGGRRCCRAWRVPWSPPASSDPLQPAAMRARSATTSEPAYRSVSRPVLGRIGTELYECRIADTDGSGGRSHHSDLAVPDSGLDWAGDFRPRIS